MNSNHFILGLVLWVGLSGSLARAADKPGAVKWLSPAQAEALSATVPPPPAPHSAADDADLAKVLAAQVTRTQATIAECKRDEKFSYTLFDSVYGSDMTAATDPKFHRLMKNVSELTRFVNETAKRKYARMRPYQGHPDVVKSLFTVDGFSYPSGHSMASFTMAVVLGGIFPEKKQAFLDRAGEIAQSRVNAGVHYPSDIHEGEVLGKATGEALLANPSFQADVADVVAELKK